MRAPSSIRARRHVVDEVDIASTILPPLDRPFDTLFSSRSRARLDNEDPLTRHFLGSANVLTHRRPRPGREATHRKSSEEYGLSALPIRVEMLSCDGGSLDFDESGRYDAENLLQDNSSVYCTAKLENVNILLRGVGARPFTLSRMVIKAPRRSFTSPVKDGLVFVSMDRIDDSDTRIFDRLDHDPEMSPRTHSECESDLQRLLLGQGLPMTTSALGNSSLYTEGPCPQAYFVVDERLGCATIDFEPAISARYVHVKLLSGQAFDNYPGRCERDNIDIQAILLYGYGRRIFPRVELR